MDTKDIVNYLDHYLRTREIRDASLNGLQVQGKPEVSKIGFAVDACLESIRAAVDSQVDLLIVHHGLFWGREQAITGSHYERIRALIEAEINLYCSHLPLDAHPEVGNNAQLARALDLDVEYYFGDHMGTPIAVYARTRSKMSADVFLETVRRVLGPHVRLDAFGPETFRNVGICSGAGASLLPEARQLGIEAFITGEPRHSYYHFSKEEKIHVYYGRHYDTEIWGLKALDEHLQELFKLPTEFFDIPSEI